jgi:hypothetical protein
MSYRSLALVAAAFSTITAASASAQSVYVAPGGVYIGAGPVYVTPAPNVPAPYAAPGFGYAPPAVVAPTPSVVAPPVVYGPSGGYYDAPLSAYGAAELPPRPPAAIPYSNGTRCVSRYNNGRHWQSCY